MHVAEYTILICLTFVQLSSCAFHIMCPHTSHAKFRMQVLCNSTFPYFNCLFDKNKQQYMEICSKETEIQSEGYKTEIRGGIDGVPCSSNHFQPFTHSSKNGASCALVKTVCSEEGQVVYDDGSFVKDRSCRCDYRVGYDFVNLPTKICYCVPSIEDCSCYMKQCKANQVLTPDYKCTREDRLTGNFHCPGIDVFESRNVREKQISESTAYTIDVENKDSNVNEELILLIGMAIGIGILSAVWSCTKYSKRNYYDCRVPKIHIKCNKYETFYGCKIVLECSFEPKTQCNAVYWLKYVNNQTTEIRSDMQDVEGSTVTNPSLILCSPMIKDSGEYVCCVVYKYGTACSQPVKLNVTESVPEIHIKCNEYETFCGSRIVLECTFESKLQCNDVYWLKCAKTRTTEIRTEMLNVGGSTVTHPSLILCSPMLEDSGEYVCCVVNKCGTAYSQPIRLNVTGGIPKVHILNNTYETCYGTRIVLRCSFESQSPCNDVYWLKFVNNRTTEIRSDMQDVEGSTVTNPSLILCSPMIKDSGEYVCCVVNKCGTACSQPIRLNVFGGVPEIYILSNIYETFYHMQIELECTFESKIPCSDVYWLKNANNRTTEIRSEMLNVEGSKVTHPSLILCSPIIEDSGEYVCCVVNKCGTAYSQPIRLNVTGDIPEFKQEEEFHYAANGDNMRVFCKIFANPQCKKLVWKKWEDNGFTTIYTDSKSYPQENLIFSSLTVENVTEADTGEYYCFATNEIGTTRSSPFYFDVNNDDEEGSYSEGEVEEC